MTSPCTRRTSETQGPKPPQRGYKMETRKETILLQTVLGKGPRDKVAHCVTGAKEKSHLGINLREINANPGGTSQKPSWGHTATRKMQRDQAARDGDVGSPGPPVRPREPESTERAHPGPRGSPGGITVDQPRGRRRRCRDREASPRSAPQGTAASDLQRGSRDARTPRSSWNIYKA